MPEGVIEPNPTLSMSRRGAAVLSLGLFSVVGVAGGNMLQGMMEGNPSSPDVPELSAAGVPSTELGIDNSDLLKVVSVIPGVVGEAPCGPKIDIAEATRRFKAGELVVKPTETAAFFDKHPKCEEGHSNIMEEHYGQKFIDWVIKNKPVLQPEVLKVGEENSTAREMMARMQFGILNGKIRVQNHQCNKDTGAIFPVNNISELNEGEQVWDMVFTKAELKQMEEDKVSVPERAPKLPSDDHEELVVIFERGPCVNPLLTRETPHQHEDKTTTTINSTTSTTHGKVTTTIKGVTTSTTRPATTSTSSTTTTTTTPTTVTTFVPPSSTTTSTTSPRPKPAQPPLPAPPSEAAPGSGGTQEKPADPEKDDPATGYGPGDKKPVNNSTTTTAKPPTTATTGPERKPAPATPATTSTSNPGYDAPPAPAN